MKKLKSRRSYSDKFKQSVVDEVNGNRDSIREIAIHRGIPYLTLYNWVRMHELRQIHKMNTNIPPRPILDINCKSELPNQFVENEQLKKENEVLRNLVVFFAKQLDYTSMLEKQFNNK